MQKSRNVISYWGVLKTFIYIFFFNVAYYVDVLVKLYLTFIHFINLSRLWNEVILVPFSITFNCLVVLVEILLLSQFDSAVLIAQANWITYNPGSSGADLNTICG